MNTAELLNQVHALRTKAARIEELARKHQEIEEELRDITGVDRVAVPYSPPPIPAPSNIRSIGSTKRHRDGQNPLEVAILEIMRAGRPIHRDEIRSRLRSYPDVEWTDSSFNSRLYNMKSRGVIQSSSYGFYQRNGVVEMPEERQDHTA